MERSLTDVVVELDSDVVDETSELVVLSGDDEEVVEVDVMLVEDGMMTAP